MTQPIERARRLLVLAERDITSFRALTSYPEVDISATGFFAQQGVEISQCSVTRCPELMPTVKLHCRCRVSTRHVGLKPDLQGFAYKPVYTQAFSLPHPAVRLKFRAKYLARHS